MALFLELVAMAVVAVMAWLGADASLQHAIAKGAEVAAPEVRSAAHLRAEALRGVLLFAGGVAVLMVGRFVSARRGRVNITAPFILPATCAAAMMGFTLQMGYGDPLHWTFWPGPEFAKGFALAALLGALVLVLPRDP